MLKIIVEKIDNELIKAANDFSDFRERVKHYLQIHGRAYDKFTVTNNDSFAYIYNIKCGLLEKC